MLAKAFSSAVLGIDAYIVEVEVDLAPGLPTFAVVGLPDASVKESRERVKAAVQNSGLDFPVRRITVNLAPADIRKEGSAYDLPIAVGLLCATGVIPASALQSSVLLGELSLDGRVKPIRGALCVALAAERAGMARLILPRENAAEAAVMPGIAVYPVDTLPQVVEFLSGRLPQEPLRVDLQAAFAHVPSASVDFAEVKGQALVKRALEVAAAGGHNVLTFGSQRLHLPLECFPAAANRFHWRSPGYPMRRRQVSYRQSQSALVVGRLARNRSPMPRVV